MLRSTLGRLVKMTAGYSLNTLIGPLLTLILTPIYTRILTPSDYGSVDTLLMLGNILFILGSLGLTSALPALYFDPDKADEQPCIIASALWVGIIWSALLTALVLLAVRPITRLALDRTDLTELTWLIAIGLTGGVIYSIQTTVLRLRFAVWRANVLALIYLLVFAGSNILFIVILRWGPAGVISAYTLTNVVTAVAALAIATESIRSLPHLPLMLQLARTGLPLVPAGLAVWVLVWEDRLFLVRTVSYAEIGFYAIANKLASMLSLLVGPFKSAWEPLALSIQQQQDAARTYAKMLTYYTVVGLGLALALSLFAREILLLFTTASYVDATLYVWMLAVVPLISGFQAILSVGLFIEKRLGRLGWALLVAAVVNTLLNVLLIPPFGVTGAALATLLGYLAIPLFIAIVAQRTRPFPFEWGRVVTVFVVYLVLAGAGIMLSDRSDLVTLSLRALLLFSYLPLLWALRIFDRHEIQLATHILRQPQLVLRRITGLR